MTAGKNPRHPWLLTQHSCRGSSEFGERVESENPSPLAALEAGENTPACFSFSPSLTTDRKVWKASPPPQMNSIPGHRSGGWGRMRSRHYFLSHPPYLPPVPLGARLYQTFTHLWLTLELFSSNKPAFREKNASRQFIWTLRCKTCKFVLVGKLRWIAFTVDLTQRGGLGEIKTGIITCWRWLPSVP